MAQSNDYSEKVDAFYINQKFDELEAMLADEGNVKAVCKISDIRREFEDYVHNANELAESLNIIKEEIETANEALQL